MKSVKANFIWNSAYQLLLIVIPLITTPYLSRVLGPEPIGVYSYSFSVANYFVLFATLGMGSYGVRVIAAASDDKTKRSEVFWGAYACQVFVSIVIVLAYGIYTVFLNPLGGVVVALAWMPWVLSAGLDVSWLFFGVEDFKLPTMRSAFTKIISVIAIFLFVKSSADLSVYCFLIAISYLLNSVLIWPFVRRIVDFYKPSFKEILQHFWPNVRLFAPVVAVSVYSSLNKIMLGTISGMDQAGFYEYSEKLSKMPLSLVTALGTVMLPRMTSSLAEGNRNQALGMLSRSMFVMQGAAMAMAFGIAAIAPVFTIVFFGAGFEPCMYIMPILCVVIPLIAASNVIGVQYMLPNYSDRAYTVSVFFGATANVLVNLLLLPRFGAIGAAVATVAAEAMVLCFQCWVVRTELPLGVYFRSSIPFILIGCLMFLLVRSIPSIFVISGSLLLIVQIATGGIFYLLMSALYLKLRRILLRI